MGEEGEAIMGVEAMRGLPGEGFIYADGDDVLGDVAAHARAAVNLTHNMVT